MQQFTRQMFKTRIVSEHWSARVRRWIIFSVSLSSTTGSWNTTFAGLHYCIIISSVGWTGYDRLCSLPLVSLGCWLQHPFGLLVKVWVWRRSNSKRSLIVIKNGAVVKVHLKMHENAMCRKIIFFFNEAFISSVLSWIAPSLSSGMHCTVRCKFS